jgi:hypothetical protein
MSRPFRRCSSHTSWLVPSGLKRTWSINCSIRARSAWHGLSFPKIISARSADAVHPRRAQQRRYQTVGLLDAVAHPCAVIGACAVHYSRWRTSSEFASGAPRQRSASDPGTRDAQCRSGAPHTRFARAIWARSGSHAVAGRGSGFEFMPVEKRLYFTRKAT